jgi:hypothetical protein
MPTCLTFFLGALIYAIYAILCYHPTLKGSQITLWGGLTCALAANFLWIVLAKATHDPNRLIFYALIWDMIVIAVGVGIPLALYASKPSATMISGLILMAIGLILVKVGG